MDRHILGATEHDECLFEVCLDLSKRLWVAFGNELRDCNEHLGEGDLILALLDYLRHLARLEELGDFCCLLICFCCFEIDQSVVAVQIVQKKISVRFQNLIWCQDLILIHVIVDELNYIM